MFHKVKMFFLYFVFTFVPKYHRISFNRLLLSLYTKFGSNKKCTFDKLNKAYCESFYDIFSNLNVNNFLTESNSDIMRLEKCVFFYWNDGINSMPKIVRLCYKNLLSTTKFSVVLITFENCKKYSNMPDFVYNWVKENKISKTTFSELLRMNLLSTHNNCIWVDSTCFLLKDFPNWIFDYDFLTIYPNDGCSIFDGIPRFNWAPDLKLQQSYFLVGKNKDIFKQIYNFYISYLQSENKVLEVLRPYYLMYFIFEYLYNTDKNFSIIVDKRESNNTYCERIEGYLNEKYINENYGKYFNSDTFLYKLSYKVEFICFKDNFMTNFGKLIELKNIDFHLI